MHHKFEIRALLISGFVGGVLCSAAPLAEVDLQIVDSEQQDMDSEIHLDRHPLQRHPHLLDLADQFLENEMKIRRECVFLLLLGPFSLYSTLKTTMIFVYFLHSLFLLYHNAEMSFQNINPTHSDILFLVALALVLTSVHLFHRYD